MRKEKVNCVICGQEIDFYKNECVAQMNFVAVLVKENLFSDKLAKRKNLNVKCNDFFICDKCLYEIFIEEKEAEVLFKARLLNRNKLELELVDEIDENYKVATECEIDNEHSLIMSIFDISYHNASYNGGAFIDTINDCLIDITKRDFFYVNLKIENNNFPPHIRNDDKVYRIVIF